MKNCMIDEKNIITPQDYDEHAIIAHEISDGLLSRLEWMTLKPGVIVNVAAKTGRLSGLLKTKFPDANIISIDHDAEMLEFALSKSSNHSCLCANLFSLPLASHSVDLFVANLVLPWCDRSILLLEAKRVLRQNGLLMFTAFAPQSFVGLSKTYDDQEMHDLGDAI